MKSPIACLILKDKASAVRRGKTIEIYKSGKGGTVLAKSTVYPSVAKAKALFNLIRMTKQAH